LTNKPIIIGVGRTSFGEHYGENPEELIEEAGLKALEKAGIERKDLDAVFISDYFLQVTNKIGIEEGFVSELLEVSIPMETLRSFSSALCCACNAIEAGRFDIVLVGGVEKMTDRLDKIRDDLMMLGDPWSYHAGGTPEAFHELMLREYVKTYHLNGEEVEKLMKALAYISCKNHYYGSTNPLAHFYKRKIRVEDAIKTRKRSGRILGLYDFAPISDGASAAIVVSPRKAREIAEKGLRVIGRGSATDYISYFARNYKAGFNATRKAVERALNEAKIPPEKIELIELYDQSTLMELIALEDLGLCKPGTAWQIIHESYQKEDYTYHINGNTLYVNTNGGLKADGNPMGATGGAQIHEAYIQLLGEAGNRQIKFKNNNPYALTMELEGFGTKSYVYILGRWENEL